MAHGRSIRIHLADGSAAGIRHAEVVNWTGQAIVCPRAKGYQTDEGFVVLSGSRGDGTTRDSLQQGWRARRDELLADGSIRQREDGIEYVRDVLFSSSSAAASVTLGGAWGGRKGWKTAEGVTLAELEGGSAEPADPAESALPHGEPL